MADWLEGWTVRLTCSISMGDAVMIFSTLLFVYTITFAFRGMFQLMLGCAYFNI